MKYNKTFTKEQLVTHVNEWDCLGRSSLPVAKKAVLVAKVLNSREGVWVSWVGVWVYGLAGVSTLRPTCCTALVSKGSCVGKCSILIFIRIHEILSRIYFVWF